MRKIHITESQLNELKRRLTEGNDNYNIDLSDKVKENGGNVGTAIRQINAANPNAAKDVSNGKANYTVDPKKIALEGCCEKRRMPWDGSTPSFGDIDYDYSEEPFYRELKSAVEDMSRDPRYQQLIFNAAENDRKDDVHALLKVISASCGIKVHPNALRQALQELDVEDYEDGDSYSEVMEGKIFTKKEIKEAKLRKMKKESRRISKKDLLK